jgi:phosphoribosyl 1,2-cyclic phosphodiesterase
MTQPATPAQLRIFIYGTQGSGSIFPSRAERLAFEARTREDLLAAVFQDLGRYTSQDGRLSCTVEEILGAPLTPKALSSYAARFEMPEPRVYGGLTTCVRIETADDVDIVLDCGSGFRPCAGDLQAKWATRRERQLHLFGSHSHLDHTEGFDQAAVCFDPRNHLHIYGNRQFLRALDFNLGIFSREVARDVQGVQTPIFYGVMPARFQAHEIRDLSSPESGAPIVNSDVHDLATPIVLGGTTITPFEVFHPAPCLAYRIAHGGKVFVFCTDHELRHGNDPGHPDEQKSHDAEARVVAQAINADLLYRDGQYLRAEYDGVLGIGGSGPVSRVGWGHSCIEDVIDMANRCHVAHTLIGHHDPNRDWSERNWLDESMARRSSGTRTRVEFARSDMVFEL